MADNELIRGIAEAVTGGALAGLSAEAQTDFLSPFLQAQQRRLDREQTREGTAYDNYRKSSSSKREAFSYAPTKSGALQAYTKDLQTSMQRALEGVNNPNLRQAILDQYEADVAYGEATFKQGRVNDFQNLASAGDFGWVADDDTELVTAGLERSAGPGSQAYANYTTFQNLAARMTNLGATTGDLPGGIGDADQLSLVQLDPQLKATIDLVNKSEGGLQTFVLENPQEGQVLLERLARINPEQIQSLGSQLTKAEGAADFRIQLRSVYNSPGAKTPALYATDLYEINEQGVPAIRPTKFEEAARRLAEHHQFAGDIFAELKSLKRAGIAGLDQLAATAIPRSAVRQPSPNYLGESLNNDVTGIVNLQRTGMLETLAGHAPFRQAVHLKKRDQAIALLNELDVPNPEQAYALFERGPAGLMSGMIEEALSPDAYTSGLMASLQDELALATVNEDQVGIAAANERLTTLARLEGSPETRAAQRVHETVMRVSASDKVEDYETALSGMLLSFKQEGFTSMGLSEEVKSELARIAENPNPLERHRQLGTLIGDVAFSKDAHSAPAQAALRDEAKRMYLNSLDNILLAIPQATRASKGFREAAGEGPGADPTQSFYAMMSQSSIDAVLANLTQSEAARDLGKAADVTRNIGAQ